MCNRQTIFIIVYNEYNYTGCPQNIFTTLIVNKYHTNKCAYSLYTLLKIKY